MIVLVCACSCAVYNYTGSEALMPVQVVPQGIESVNESNINMGYASPLVQRGGVPVE